MNWQYTKSVEDLTTATLYTSYSSDIFVGMTPAMER